MLPTLVVATVVDLASVTLEDVSEDGTPQLLYVYEGEPVSPWHDLPFEAGASRDGAPLLTFVCEIPRGTRAKMEIHKGVDHNMVLQDTNKDGSLRFYAYGDSIVNYGAIAQTWEDPEALDPDTGLGGDNDPVDVLQLDAKPCEQGALQRVRVLGALALVDGGETDWKLLVVEEGASDWKDLDDIPRDRVEEVRDWFRLYKTAEGKGENTYAFGGNAVDARHALGVARRTHDHWRALVDGTAACSFKGKTCWVEQADHFIKSELR